MKRIICLLVCCLLFVAIVPVTAFANDTEITPYWNNALRVNYGFNIDSNGEATVTVSYIGYSGMTGATITSKIQKQQTNGTWVDVDIDTANNEWVDTSSNITFSTTHSVTVPRGTYRALIDYEIRGSKPTDTISDIIERTY